MAEGDPHELIQIFPGKGGLDTEKHSTLIQPDRSPDLENVEFNRSSLLGSRGWRKLHRDLPFLAGTRFCPRPIFRSAAETDKDLCPYGIIPWIRAQDPIENGANQLQIDISFRLNHQRGETLTGADQSAENDQAPPGGEFQFQPLVGRGGDDVQHPNWALGLVTWNPAGYEETSFSIVPKPELIRPVLYWWNYSASLMDWVIWDAEIRPGFPYHFTLQIDKQGGGGTRLLIDGAAVSQLDSGVSGSLPTLDLISTSTHYFHNLYICKVVDRNTGKFPNAPLMRGYHDVAVTAATTNSVTVNPSEFVAATTAWGFNYFVRVTTGAGAGDIRRIASVTGTGPWVINVAAPVWSTTPSATDLIDIIPPKEDCPQDITIQEFRMWNAFQTDAVIQALVGLQAVKDINSTLAEKNRAYLEGADETELVGYWSLSDDEGGVFKERTTLRNHGWFSSWGGPYDEDPSLFLDGERISAQMDLADEPAFQEAWRHNLGADGELNIHFRATFSLGRDLVSNDEANQEDGLYETICEWGDPAQQEPLFSLRWTKHTASDIRRFYIVWHDGTASNIETVANARETSPSTLEFALGIYPWPGRVYSMVAGIQRTEAAGGDHRFYVMITDGTTTGKGYSNIIAAPEISVIDFAKSRVSFGASVYGESTKGSGSSNALLGRFWECGWALRPSFDQRTAAGNGPANEVRELTLDRWTTSDKVKPGQDTEVEWTAENTAVVLTQGSKDITSASGRNWTNDYGSYPVKHLLVVPAVEHRRIEEDRSPKIRPRFIHVNSLTLNAGTLSEFWSGKDLPEAEVRVAAYIGYTDFRRPLLKNPGNEIPMQASPRDGELWALAEAWADEGVLGSAGAGVAQEVPWHLATIPSAAGNPQQFYRPQWGEGIIKGREPVQGLAEWKGTAERRRSILALVRGSLYRVEPRWVRDHPFFGEDDTNGNPQIWCLEFFNIPDHIAAMREIDHTDGLPFSRRKDPYFNEGLRHPDGTNGAELKLPSDPGSNPYYLFETWIKLRDLEGKRTLLSRVATKKTAAGTALAEKINVHIYLLEGAPVIETYDEETSQRYKVTLANDDKVRVRQYFKPADKLWDKPGKGWTKLSIQFNITDTNTFGTDHAFFINGFTFGSEHILNEGSMQPNDIPDETSSSLIGVYGHSQDSDLYTDFRWSLEGRMAGFTLTRSDAPFLT